MLNSYPSVAGGQHIQRNCVLCNMGDKTRTSSARLHISILCSHFVCIHNISRSQCRSHFANDNQPNPNPEKSVLAHRLLKFLKCAGQRQLYIQRYYLAASVTERFRQCKQKNVRKSYF